MHINSLYFIALLLLPAIILIPFPGNTLNLVRRITGFSGRLKRAAVPVKADLHAGGQPAFHREMRETRNMRSFPRKGILLMTGVILLSGTSCVDDIELNLTPEQYSRLVVHGSVTDSDSAQTVILTKTIPYDKHEPNPPATGAMVTIEVDGTGYLLEEVSPGYYETRDFIGQVGKTYVLNILYENETYTASSTMHQGFEIDSIEFRRFLLGWPADMPHYEILVYGQDPPEPDDFFLFKYSIDGVWADTLYKWSIYADIFNNGEYIEGESVTIIESRADSLEIQLMSMSVGEDYAWFVNDAIFNYMPNMFFSPPKANVQGNVSNGAFGYFLAASVRYSEKTMLYRSDFETGGNR
jgi:hypothetical protein